MCEKLGHFSSWLLSQAQVHQNQPYDESLEVPDAEEIASQYSPTPRVNKPGKF